MSWANNKPPKYRKKVPNSPLQMLAQKENFVLFQIKSMLGRLHSMKGCATVPQSSVLSIENTLKGMEKKIKNEQQKRKLAREVANDGQA